MALISGLIGAGLGVAHIHGTRQQKRQSELQRQQFEADRAHTEQREDTAMLRSAEQARQLGLHPSLAVGGAPSASIQQGSSGSDSSDLFRDALNVIALVHGGRRPRRR